MNVKHELVADIPLIIEFCKRINLPSILDKHLPFHGNLKGLSYSKLTMAWIAHILTQNNHCKSPVQDWSWKHQITLQALLEQKIICNDFDDCQLSRLLDKFAEDNTWHALEESFYKDSFAVLNLDITAPEDFKEMPSATNGIAKTIKVDATTAYGYHKVTDNGIMQRGFSNKLEMLG